MAQHKHKWELDHHQSVSLPDPMPPHRLDGYLRIYLCGCGAVEVRCAKYSGSNRISVKVSHYAT